ncbi:hypothetical protein NGB36_28160 [Streptomyces sp. RB6PN25]|uniref:Uncharacterized protein n=1 Tax=Streptomyces humicola TaxID=2953240 RepID=A0ABT1Q348_9ACTN|nr:hypothetical protein [Streptomyces humicola]MCQ4084351.1 hypothetical protein [Streptomyces humicola]
MNHNQPPANPYPYGQQPGYGPPQQPQKKSRKGLFGCLGCSGALALLVIIGLVAAGATGTTTGAHSNSSGSPTATAPSSSALNQKPTPTAAPTVVMTDSGSGIKNTPSFTVGGNWTLQYTFNCAALGQPGNFIVTDETGMPLANELKSQGSGQDPQYDAGTHHLQINSECDWTVKVVNGG